MVAIGFVKRKEQNGGHAQLLQIRELPSQTVQIAVGIAIAVVETALADMVYNFSFFVFALLCLSQYQLT
jgi:hypothetical protein